MKKICLSVVGLYLMFLSAFSQQSKDDTTTYKNKKLRLDEVNLVSGYYNQNGNHSAVTGGIGTQKLSDVSNTIELKFINWGGNNNNNKYTLDVAAGIDYHTAASQAWVSKTGASKPYGTRIYPSVNWKVEKENKLSLGFGISYSSEFNYHSYGLSFLAGKVSKDENTELNFKAQAFFDKVTLIEPSEFAPKASPGSLSTYTTASGMVISSYSGASSRNIPKSPRNTFSGSLSLSHIVNKTLQFALISDVVAQNGYLGLPFHRVYFNYNNTDTAKIENLPRKRFKLPIGLRVNYFATDKIILRAYYRYYTDNWGIRSHTASLELPYKISPFVSIAPFYRYYTQTAADYFAPYKVHLLSDKYYTSNYDFSAFNSHFAGLNFRFTPEKGIYIFDMVEFRYGHYFQSTGLQGDNIGLNIRLK
jgi:hypothetical protein